MNPIDSDEVTTLQLFEPSAEVVYSIDQAARLVHVPRRRIALYFRHGLISPIVDPETGGWYFDTEAIRRLRHIEYLKSSVGMNLTAIRLFLNLVGEVEHLRREVRFLREL